jgi:hypothetical protein
VYSYNFASGGATTDAKLVTPFASTVLSFVDQVNLYLKSSKTAGFTKWNAANSIFAVWIGVNVSIVTDALRAQSTNDVFRMSATHGTHQTTPLSWDKSWTSTSTKRRLCTTPELDGSFS